MTGWGARQIVMTLEQCGTTNAALSLTVGNATAVIAPASSGYATVTTTATTTNPINVVVGFAAPAPAASTAVPFRVSSNLNGTLCAWRAVPDRGAHAHLARGVLTCPATAVALVSFAATPLKLVSASSDGYGRTRTLARAAPRRTADTPPPFA